MEEDVREQAKKEAEEIWEKELKEQFSRQINQCLMETLKTLQGELKQFDSSINSHIEQLDEQFEKKWNDKFQNEMSQIEKMKSQIEIQNNNEQNQIKYNNINNNNNDFNLFNNNDDDNLDDNNLVNEEKKLRKIPINLNILNIPPITKLTLSQNMNPLVNLILHCLCNMNYIAYYYLNPLKEDKILYKSKQNPNSICLGPSFLKLLDYVWKSNKKEYSPNEIHNNLQKLMGDNYNSKDPGLIMSFILNKLNEELILNPQIYNGEDDPLIYYNEKNSLNLFLNKNKTNTSNISQRFFAIILTKKNCSVCTETFYFEYTPVINIYLKAINNVNYNQFNYLNEFNLKEHLKTLLMPNESENIRENCFVCGEEKNKFVSKDIYTISEILIINIDRQKDENNIISFEYPEKLKTNDIINNKDMDATEYELISVFMKYKNNNNQLQFYILYKSFVNKQWYSFNNQKIELIKNYQQNIFDKKKATLLIYSKIRNQN